MTAHELGKLLYEARVREAWGKRAQSRLDKHPFPRHPADADVRTQTAEADLAMAQAKALLKLYDVVPKMHSKVPADFR